ncbi:MAG: acylphosphatase [Acidimicrobiia bacterium]|nr:acylphosphatase [Acidimicrobiia bacterium]
MTAPVRRRVVVTGRVQGVWFRESCRREAVAVGVAGWVRNASDGTVEAVLEGPPAAVERVVRWCRSGPSGARVEAIDVSVESPVGERGFRVA